MNTTVLAFIAGILLLLIVLWDAFETMVLPRRVRREIRLARLFYRSLWKLWLVVWRKVPGKKARESFLSFFGPLSLLLLLIVWAAALILSFGLLQYSLGSVVEHGGRATNSFTYLYLSATTFFTLGIGDVTPGSQLARALTAIESGVGFGFLAIVIGYLPVIHQSFSRREVSIAMLDARAGSPPTAGELLRRYSYSLGLTELQKLLADWERWSAELLESHLSYPVLAYFRSQHDNQSWLASLTTILDTCALLMTGPVDSCQRQAELTFAIARHAVVDLAQVFDAPPKAPEIGRLTAEDLQKLRPNLATLGIPLREGAEAEQRLTQLRALYEPYVASLARSLYVKLPPWTPQGPRKDNWQTSAWGRISGVLQEASPAPDDHE
ncbi:MAG TPA: potassium channel family protein [Candidatus Dormibacteraeota bacterium]|nr:potassium channel family protein [Candidatus Dormibacteraeota bacterium]